MSNVVLLLGPAQRDYMLRPAAGSHDYLATEFAACGGANVGTIMAHVRAGQPAESRSA
jgi:hypothetical protein